MKCLPRKTLKQLIVSAFAAGCLSPALLFADTLTWDGSDSTWGSASNWLVNGSPSSRAPASGDTVNIDSGTVTSGTVNLGGMTINHTGGTRVITGTDYTLSNGMVIYHTGGTLKFSNTASGNRWLNVGETPGGVAYYHLDGGIFTNVKQLYVGRRGEGHMTIANSDVTVDHMVIGYEVRKSKNSDITLNSGSLTTNAYSYVGGASGASSSYLGTSTLNINGGTFTNNDELSVGNFAFGSDVTGVEQRSVVNQTGGAWVANGEFYLGNGNSSTGTGNKNIAEVNLSGGTANFKNVVYFGGAVGAQGTMTVSGTANVVFDADLNLGHRDQANGTLNLTGGTAQFNSFVNVGTAAGGNGTLALSGGTNTFGQRVNLGTASGGNGTMTLSGGTNTFNNEIFVGWTSGAVGTMNINGGTNAFNNKIHVGGWKSDNTGGTGYLNISADTTFTKEVCLGSGGTGVMNVTGGNVDFNLNGQCFYIGTRTNGTLNISGDANISFNSGNDVHVGENNGTGIVNQTGGTFTSTRWINIGERGTGTWTISGGQLNTQGYFGVGRRGKGILNISGTADVNSTKVFVGTFPEAAGGSELNVSGGTLDGTNLYVGGNPEYDNENGALTTRSSSMTVTGGTVNFTEESGVGHTGKNGKGGIGILNIAGGTTTFEKNFFVGKGDRGVGTLNVSDGTLHVKNESFFGDQGKAVINVTGGTLTLDKTTWLGQGDADAVAEMYITGGTVNGPSGADLRIGANNSQAKLVVDGGTLNNRYNLVIDANSTVRDDGTTGTIIELHSGMIKTPWFSLGQNAHGSDPRNTFIMTGGRLEVANDLRLGFGYYSDINISGGEIIVNGTARLAHNWAGTATEAGAALNITGSDTVWNVNDLEWESSGKVNFTSERLEMNADGTASSPVSNIQARGNVTVDSQIHVDTTGFYYDGAAFMSALPTADLFTAAGTLNWNPASVTEDGAWELEKDEKSIRLVLDESQLASTATINGSLLGAGKLGESGWVLLSGTPETEVDLIMMLSGEGSVDELVLWLTDQMADANSGIGVTAGDASVTFTDIPLNIDGLAYMNYDLTAFNLAAGSTFAFANGVPEPGTWLLLVTGMGLLLWRRKRS
ncbi:MAG: PEP-CTERM sorting domain-containing protein [Thermoguttaceae bacterium]|nr:PEP-CTERM sorting domain-containing protein [Thermoguttaceae bacterium]